MVRRLGRAPILVIQRPSTRNDVFRCRRGITAVIPEPDDQKRHRTKRGSSGGRPSQFNTVDYKDRNVIERGFCDTKQWRGLATRYDKLAVTYRGAAVLRAITLWLKQLGDTP